ncbi:hypothetical protein BX070DRAFT_219273 [Coemansia spiralis]|nr:hypothetical protein BX070DRAFT_219273 [Coemansia spiralis]
MATQHLSAADWHIREYHITLPPNETVASKSQVEPEKQRLIFCGRLLSNDAQTLNEAGMSDGCALHMVAGRAPSPNSASPQPQQQRQSRSRAAHFVISSAAPFSSVISETLQRIVIPEVSSDNATQASSETTQQQPSRQSMRPPTFSTSSTNEHGAASNEDQVAHIVNIVDLRSGDNTAGTNTNRRGNLRPGPTPADYPISPSSAVETFQPISGFVPIPRSMNVGLPQTAGHRAQRQLQDMDESDRLQPTPAQANELIYDLFENVLPSIRRHPGREDFHFNTSSSMRPTYITQSTPDQIGAVGGALANLGDAFVELGRSLREVGLDWQAHDNGSASATGSAYSPVHMQAVLQTLLQLQLASPLAIPFLQNTISRSSDRRQYAHENGSADARPDSGDRVPNNNNNIAPQPSQQSNYFQRSLSRRINRQHALASLVNSNVRNRQQNATTGMPFNVVGDIGISFLPPVFIGPSVSERHQRRGADGTDRNVGSRNSAVNSEVPVNSNAGGESNGRPGDISGIPRFMHRTMRSSNSNHVIEAIFEQMGIPRPIFNNNAARSQSGSEPQNTQQQQQQSSTNTDVNGGVPAGAISPSDSNTASSMPDADTNSPGGVDGNSRFFNFIESLSTLGNRHGAPSDMSNASTTTEYSTGNTGNGIGSARAQRMFTINGPLASPPIPLSQTMNPFSFASVFLGAEPGSTRNTSRRTSISSNLGVNSDAATTSATAAPTAAQSSLDSRRPARSQTSTQASNGFSNDGDANVEQPTNTTAISNNDGSLPSTSNIDSRKRHKANGAVDTE